MLVKRAVFLLNAVFAMKILNLISRIPLASLFITTSKYLKYSTWTSCFLFIVICISNDCLEILITLVFSTFISIPVSITQSRVLIYYFNILIKIMWPLLVYYIVRWYNLYCRGISPTTHAHTPTPGHIHVQHFGIWYYSIFGWFFVTTRVETLLLDLQV